MNHISTRESFLLPETRDGEFFSREKKLALGCMLDMLEEVVRVCRKYGLTYYANGGTMIGAARHKGFIPWDDDLDIMMPRKDYEKLQQVLPSELPPHLFMQTTLTDPEFMFPLVKIRDSRTSAIDLRYIKKGIRFHMGIFIDIFPIDGVPDDPVEEMRRAHEVVKFWPYMTQVCQKRFETTHDRLRHLYRLACFKLKGRRRFCLERERVVSSFAIEGCCECANAILCFGYGTKSRWPSELLKGPVVELPFEYLDIAVPAGYLRILEMTYGDWRVPIRGAACHGPLILDAEVPYQEKVAQLGYRW